METLESIFYLIDAEGRKRVPKKIRARSGAYGYAVHPIGKGNDSSAAIYTMDERWVVQQILLYGKGVRAVTIGGEKDGQLNTVYRHGRSITGHWLAPQQRAWIEGHTHGYPAKTGMVPREVRMDGQMLWLVEQFLASDNPQLYRWYPHYRQTLRAVREALQRGDADTVFEIVWKSKDNYVSNAGQGLLGAENAERSREILTQLIIDVAADGSPAQYEVVISKLQAERESGRQKKVPYLLAARMFSAIHPERYHTTVDEQKQAGMLPWFEAHSGFSAPKGNWAEVSHALTQHLDNLECFSGDIYLRNMFPWFLHTRLVSIADVAQVAGKAKLHKPRPVESFMHLPEQRRKIELRHNFLSAHLANELEIKHPGQVMVEKAAGSGGTFDVLVLSSHGTKKGGDLYEIKVARSAGIAVRQALGQLLEYAHRESGLEPAHLYVAAEPELDDVTARFLERLRNEYGIEIYYYRIKMPREASASFEWVERDTANMAPSEDAA